MASTYWHVHPRNFSNECVIVRAETREEGEELESGGYERLTRRELARHVRWLNSENEAWGSGRAFGHISLRDVTKGYEYLYSYRLQERK